jgi:hypothetical protein
VTNGILLGRRGEGLLEELDDLAISLHTLDEDAGDALLGGGAGTTRQIVESLLRCAALRDRGAMRFHLSVSCVAIPSRLGGARAVMEFCFAHGIAFTLMPQSVGPYPHPDLRGSAEYVELVEEILEAKRRGAPVWGSYAYYRCIRDLERFTCYPTLFPRVYPNGDLAYPCPPLGKVAGSLRSGATFEALFTDGVRRHGPPPTCDARCFASCYVETSFAMSHPEMVVWENLELLPRLKRAIRGWGGRQQATQIRGGEG